MPTSDNQLFETDPRFPSGPWTGFFLQPLMPGRHWMELRLTFRGGVLTGEGRDWVGHFIIRGRYTVADGRCHWTKRYIGQHDVFYNGFNEGKGIWGTWDIPENWPPSVTVFQVPVKLFEGLPLPLAVWP